MPAQPERVAPVACLINTGECTASPQRETPHPPYLCLHAGILLPHLQQNEPPTRPSLAHSSPETAHPLYRVLSTLRIAHNYIAREVPVTKQSIRCWQPCNRVRSVLANQ